MVPSTPVRKKVIVSRGWLFPPTVAKSVSGVGSDSSEYSGNKSTDVYSDGSARVTVDGNAVGSDSSSV